MRKDIKKRLEKALITLQEPGGSTIRSIIKVINQDTPILSLRKVLEALQEGINEGFLCMYNGRFKLKQQVYSENDFAEEATQSFFLGKGKDIMPDSPIPNEESEYEVEEEEEDEEEEEGQDVEDDEEEEEVKEEEEGEEEEEENEEEEGEGEDEEQGGGQEAEELEEVEEVEEVEEMDEEGEVEEDEEEEEMNNFHNKAITTLNTRSSQTVFVKHTKKTPTRAPEKPSKPKKRRFTSKEEKRSKCPTSRKPEKPGKGSIKTDNPHSASSSSTIYESMPTKQTTEKPDLKKQRGPRCTSMKKDVRMPSKVHIPFVLPSVPQRSNNFNDLLRRSPEPVNGPLYDNVVLEGFGVFET